MKGLPGTRPKLALYWAASCGGCEVAVLNLHEKFLDLTDHFELFFCPCLVDSKKSDVAALPDGALAITLFNGGIRTDENIEMAHLLRRKSELLIAFGSCAVEGCIPGLANLSRRDEIFDASYQPEFATENPDGIIPRPESSVPEGTLRLPAVLETLAILRDVTTVDYFIPGCPPEPARIWDVVGGIIDGRPLPPRGSTIGAGDKAVCEECRRERDDKAVPRFRRTWEILPDTGECLLDQGIVCMGIATRSGCGALCPAANMPCTGCYGSPDGVIDQGARMVGALGSVIDVSLVKDLPKEQISGRIAEIMGTIEDPAGTFYKYSLAASTLKGERS